MLLNIKPLEEYADKVHQYYDNHAKFHDGDSGYDLYCLEDQVVEPNEFAVKVPLGFSAEAVVKNSTHKMVAKMFKLTLQLFVAQFIAVLYLLNILPTVVVVILAIIGWGVNIRVSTKQYPTSYKLFLRSSTGCNTPIRLSNGTGIIDAGYRGQLMALVYNISDKPFTLKAGERYFQICSPTLGPIKAKVVEEISDTSRGDGGFGSTGK